MSKEKLLKQIDKEILEFEKSVKVKDRNRKYFITSMNYTNIRKLIETVDLVDEKYLHIFLKDDFFESHNWNDCMSTMTNNNDLFEELKDSIEYTIEKYLSEQLISKLEIQLDKYIETELSSKILSNKELVIEKSESIARKQEIIDTLHTYLLPIGTYELLLQLENSLEFLEENLDDIEEENDTYLLEDNAELKSALEILTDIE